MPSNYFRNPRGPLSKLEQTFDDHVIFPLDLNEVGNFIAFDIHKYQFMAKDSLERVDAKKTIFLPLPSNLGTQYSQGYNTEELGLAGQFGAGVGETVNNAGSGNIVNSLIDKAKNLGKQDAKEAVTYYATQGLEDGAGQLAGALFGGLPGVLAGAAAQQAVKGGFAGAGAARNPHLAMLYDGPEFRTHSFEYKFVPKNQKESERLQSIIYDLKYYSSPGYVNGNSHYFDYPELFDITFSFPEFLFSVAPSFLTGIEVQYHGEGTAQYHTVEEKNSKAPVSVNLTLTFQESTIQTKETIKNQPGYKA